MSDFWHQWGDKIILVFLIIMFTGVAVWGFYVKNADLSSFSSDLAKQLVSAILTLLVAARTAWPKNGGTNGTTTTNGSSGTSSTTSTASTTH